MSHQLGDAPIEPRWLQDFLRANPRDAHGRPFYRLAGRTKTPMGLHAAQGIARDLAAKLNIHSITRRQGYGNMGPSAQCTCGFNVHSHRGRSGESNVAGMVGQHLRQVRTNTLPPAYRLSGLPS